jgi:hypothetical protein
MGAEVLQTVIMSLLGPLGTIVMSGRRLLRPCLAFACITGCGGATVGAGSAPEAAPTVALPTTVSASPAADAGPPREDGPPDPEVSVTYVVDRP